jgi:tetratricopeptide (TPR) repeat protein
LNPADSEAYFNLGVLLVAENQFDQAEEAYQKGLALQPNSIEGQFNIGAFYEFHKEDLQKAKHHYQKYLDLGGTDQRLQELLQ